MRNVRIYKDDIRVNILRSLFFTDTVLVVIGALVIGVALYFFFNSLLHFFSWGYYISALIVCTIFFIAFITQKIDNQPIFRIVPRALRFNGSKKKSRYHDLEDYFVDFSIQDNLIIRNNSIVRMYEIEPYDVALLNEQDREHFFVKLKQALHTLPSSVQFIVRKERATSKNYSPHFFSLYDGSNKKREPLIEKYIEDLTALIDSEPFVVTRHYGVFSVSCNTQKPHDKVAAIKKLDDIGLRFASALAVCNIGVRILENDELIQFAKTTLR